MARLQMLNATLQFKLMSQRHRLTRLAGKLLLTSGWRPSASKRASCSNQQLESSSGCGPSAVRAGKRLQAHEQRVSSAAQRSLSSKVLAGCLSACLSAKQLQTSTGFEMDTWAGGPVCVLQIGLQPGQELSCLASNHVIVVGEVSSSRIAEYALEGQRLKARAHSQDTLKAWCLVFGMFAL